MAMEEAASDLDLDATTTAMETTAAGTLNSGSGSSNSLLATVAFCVMAAIIAVGAVGNSIVLYVYARKKDGHAANIFIMSLAVSDLIACALVIPMSIAMEVNDYQSNVFVCKLYYLLNCSGIPFSCMLMSAIAVERYFCICKPFLRAITVPRAKAIVLTLGAIAFTLGLTIAAFCSAVVRKFDYGPNGTVYGYASYGECREIRNLKRSLNDTSINSPIYISDASLLFYNIFQKLHLSLYGINIVLVFALYVKIYDSVLRLRRKRRERHQNRLQLAPVSQQRGGQGVSGCAATSIGGAPPARLQQQQKEVAEENEDDDSDAAAALDGVNGDDKQAATVVLLQPRQPELEPELQPQQQPQQKQQQQQQLRRKSQLRLMKDSDALQNLKTAAMLFVVTIVFTTTFIPAALMTLHVIAFNILIFYLYYLTHATNPLIYCFMNRNFRDDLHKIFYPAAAQQRQMRQHNKHLQQQQQQPLVQKQPASSRYDRGHSTVVN